MRDPGAKDLTIVKEIRNHFSHRVLYVYVDVRTSSRVAKVPVGHGEVPEDDALAGVSLGDLPEPPLDLLHQPGVHVP